VFALRETNPQFMQDLYVAGYPFGVNLSSSIKVTKGIGSSLTGLGNNFFNIQTDAAIQPANSGGLKFEDSGNVLGVAVAPLDIEYVLNRFDAISQNTNFSIKANIVSNLLSSNGIETTEPSTSAISTTQLGVLRAMRLTAYHF
jgi:S1-C subfamily serine protease